MPGIDPAGAGRSGFTGPAIQAGGEGGFPTRGQLEAGPLTGASLGTGSRCHGGDGVESSSHLFLASSRYRVNPTSAVTAAPSATRSQKDATPSSTAFRWLQGNTGEAGECGCPSAPTPHREGLGVPQGEHSTRGNSPAEGEARRDSPSPRAEHSSPGITIKPREGRGAGGAVPSPALETALQHLNN